MIDLNNLNKLILSPDNIFKDAKQRRLDGDITEYTIQKFSKGKKELLFVGTVHIKDPSKPIISELLNQIKLFRPEMSLIEGHPNLSLYKDKLITNLKTLGQAGYKDGNIIRTNIRRKGETGHFAFLLAHNNYDFDTAEPNKFISQELFKLGFSYEEIFVLEVLRFLVNFYRSPYLEYLEITFRKSVAESLSLMKELNGWDDFDFSFDNFKIQFQIIMGQEFIITNKLYNIRSMNYFRSIELNQSPTRLQQINYQTMILRDQSVMSQIYKYINKYDRVMINMGRGHLYTLMPALEALFESIGEFNRINKVIKAFEEESLETDFRTYSMEEVKKEIPWLR